MQLLEGYVATVAQQGGVCITHMEQKLNNDAVTQKGAKIMPRKEEYVLHMAPRGNDASFKGCILYINEAVKGGV